MERTKTIKEHLRYEFTEKEMRDIAKDLAKGNQDLESIEREKKQVVAAFAARATETAARVSRLAGYIREGYDYRDVECQVNFHLPRTGVKTIWRMDTGETVREVPMDKFELQEVLPFAEEEAEQEATTVQETPAAE